MKPLLRIIGLMARILALIDAGGAVEISCAVPIHVAEFRHSVFSQEDTCGLLSADAMVCFYCCSWFVCFCQLREWLHQTFTPQRQPAQRAHTTSLPKRLNGITFLTART